MKAGEYAIEAEVDKEVDALIHLLTQKEEIIAFKAAEENIKSNKWVQKKVDCMREKQKSLVHFEYYEKPLAYKKTSKELEELNTAIDTNISVQKYRTSLVEANEIVQFLFKRIQNEIDTINN